MTKAIQLAAMIMLAAANAQAQPSANLPAGYHIGTVRYVTDGDTVNVAVAKSQWIVAGKLSLRAAGIDTPEKSKINAKCAAEVQKGLAATAYAKTLLPAGTVVRFYPRGKDKYFRIDATIILPDGRDYAAVMLAAGYAKPWLGRGAKPNWC